MKEQRLAIRYSVDSLPDNLQTFLLDGMGDRAVEVETFDASSIGIGLIATAPSTLFTVGDHIILNSVYDKVKLVGEIRFVHSKNDDSCQLGIQFKQSRSLARYRQLLSTVVEKSGQA
jgi:hypothetical protein